MEPTGVLKFRRIAGKGDDAVSDGETDREDSFFDLVFRSPDRFAIGRGEEAAKKDFRFVRSPRGVLQSGSGALSSKASSPVTLLRSTPKFKVLFAFSFRKSSKGDKTLTACDFSSITAKIDASNSFTAGCGVKAAAGDNSLRSQLLREASDCGTSPVKIPSRDAVPKLLRLIKPLYPKVRKRQNEKARSSDSSKSSSPPAPAKFSQKMFSEGSRTGSFKMVTKHLRKSRSVSAAVGVPPPPPARRRDVSLLEQHDGILGAVLYCKKSYKSSGDFSQLLGTSSDHRRKKSVHDGRRSCEGPIIRCSI